MRHLITLGRSRIATITGPMDQTASVDRLHGYHDMLMDADPKLIAKGDFTEAGGARAMAELLDRVPDLDAVFVASDLMACGALRALREHGRRVPEDVTVVGFDDMAKVAELTDPPLTTVRQEIEEMGRLMVRLLLRSLGQPAKEGSVGRPLSSVITPTWLVRRATARPTPTRRRPTVRQ
ncbi:substrate-binding family protein [Streptomyces sp. SLBN-118]|nr:substrate-binding family protein [Streptomyces sp. SLBN-118]